MDTKLDTFCAKLDTSYEMKITPLDDLASLLRQHRERGELIVHCHGAFDLLHIGHLKHLAAARRHGDVLVVTVTADEFILKGPDRPVFDSQLRAEMLAALEVVDYVAVVEANSAAPAIRAIRPDFYVKGSEYENPEKDITGKIIAERELVESLGGRLVFTHEITRSSSNLLNRHFGTTNGAALEYLNGKRGTGLEGRIAEYLDRIADMRILIVGETIIDRYVYVEALGKAAKENIIATLQQSEEEFAGGVVAAANHLAALCPNVELVTLLGNAEEKNNFEELVRKSLSKTVTIEPIYRSEGPTVTKTRFVEPTYVRKLFEVYDMNDEPPTEEVQEEFQTALREKLPHVDLVIVCDFGHGFLRPDTVALLESEAKLLAVNAQSNAGNIGFNLISKYRRADFVCVDALEARLAAHQKHLPLDMLAESMRRDVIECRNLAVTSGKAGCYTVDADQPNAVHIPAFANGTVDTVGAGDAFFVVAAGFIAAGADCEIAGIMGNVAGAIKVGIVGHRRYLSKLELQSYLTTLLK